MISDSTNSKGRVVGVLKPQREFPRHFLGTTLEQPFQIPSAPMSTSSVSDCFALVRCWEIKQIATQESACDRRSDVFKNLGATNVTSTSELSSALSRIANTCLEQALAIIQKDFAEQTDLSASAARQLASTAIAADEGQGSNFLLDAITYSLVGFTVLDKQSVAEFLATRTALLPILQGARKVLMGIFSDARLTIDVRNAEHESDWIQLFLSIYSPSATPDSAIKGMDRFDNDWWLDNIGRAGTDLCIIYEHQ